MHRPLLAALALGLAAPAGAQPLDPAPRVAVMSAYAPEWTLLTEALEGSEEHVVHGTRFLTGTLEGQDVVLFLSGISMVNAAMTTQMALDRFEVEAILFSGIAGGVDPTLRHRRRRDRGAMGPVHGLRPRPRDAGRLRPAALDDERVPPIRHDPHPGR